MMTLVQALEANTTLECLDLTYAGLRTAVKRLLKMVKADPACRLITNQY